MTVWSARAVAFQGFSLLTTVCAVGCGTGSGGGHQVTGNDAAAASPAEEGTGGGRNYFPTEIRGRPTDAGVARSGATDAAGGAGSTSRTERPDADAGSPEPPEPPEPSCVPEAGSDEPDEDFVDSNCDGIDGDVATAVFVAPSGSDDAEGSMDAPVATVKRGVAIAAAAGKSVYLCNAEYPESLELSGTGVNIYGGYACDRGWRRELDRATLKPPSGIPFVAKSVTTPMVVERVAFRALNAEDPGGSSIAASVVASAQIRFVRVFFEARDAQAGKAGRPIYDPPRPPIRQERAESAVPVEDADLCFALSPGDPYAYGGNGCTFMPAGAGGRSRACDDGTEVRGGRGGDGGNYFWSLPSGSPGSPGIPAGSQLSGEAGAVGDFGNAASSGFGTIADGIYVANNNGHDGGYGRSGTSGRGGDGSNGVTGNTSPVTAYRPGGGGGQGGYAGCGGHGGRKGYGGGASLALIAVDSSVVVEWCTLETGRGGNGGDGGNGAPGTLGGFPGKGAAGAGTASKGGDGGGGGDGGPGGSGGPGGGGPSVGIAWVGKAPATSNVTFELGSPGRGGISHNGATAPAGVGAEIYPAGK